MLLFAPCIYVVTLLDSNKGVNSSRVESGFARFARSTTKIRNFCTTQINSWGFSGQQPYLVISVFKESGDVVNDRAQIDKQNTFAGFAGGIGRSCHQGTAHSKPSFNCDGYCEVNRGRLSEHGNGIDPRCLRKKIFFKGFLRKKVVNLPRKGEFA